MGDHITNDSTLTLTRHGEANGTVKVYDGATLLGSAVANGSGAWTYTTAALANSTHSLTATATMQPQYQCGLGGVERDDRYHGAVAPTSPRSRLTRHRGRRITTANADADRHGGSQYDGQVYDGATLLGSAVANGSGASIYRRRWRTARTA